MEVLTPSTRFDRKRGPLWTEFLPRPSDGAMPSGKPVDVRRGKRRAQNAVGAFFFWSGLPERRLAADARAREIGAGDAMLDQEEIARRVRVTRDHLRKGGKRPAA